MTTLQHKTRQELANEYGVDVKTLLRWITKRGIALEKRDRITPNLINSIYELLGQPSSPTNPHKE